MRECLPPRYRLLDLLFALFGTVTFLLDLGSDVYGAVSYYQAGDVAWAALLLGFYALSSAALQLLSWGWFWVDRQEQPGAREDKGASESNALTSGEEEPSQGQLADRSNGHPGHEEEEPSQGLLADRSHGHPGQEEEEPSQGQLADRSHGHPGHEEEEPSQGQLADRSNGHPGQEEPSQGQLADRSHWHPGHEEEEPSQGQLADRIHGHPGHEEPSQGQLADRIHGHPGHEEEEPSQGLLADRSNGHPGYGKSRSGQIGCPTAEGLAGGERVKTGEDVPGDRVAAAGDLVPGNSTAEQLATDDTGTAQYEDSTQPHAAPGEVFPRCPMDLSSDQAGTGDTRLDKEMPFPAGDSQVSSLQKHFYTSRHLFCLTSLTILHILQLGYPLRCIHSLEVGISAYKTNEESSSYEQYQEYAYFLTHDISMMRLVETFLENTPQLILLLYIVLQRGVIQTFQYFSIAVSLFSISWAILDYHQSLRMFLEEKQKLNIISSAVYFLWNGLLIFARIVCVTLFTAVFHCWIALHFLMLWLVFFLWATLQQTVFMENYILEHFYRAIVAAILYFSWFNIAEGKTIFRCVIYHSFIIIDSVILLVSCCYMWLPPLIEPYMKQLLLVVVLAFTLGLMLRVVYYKYLHPNVTSQEKKLYDEIDGIQVRSNGENYKALILKQETDTLRNPRLLLLSKSIY